VSTFLELQNAVMSDRFDESQRGDVKTWINDCYWDVWHLEEWSFRYATATVSVTAGSQNVTGTPTDLAIVRSFQRGDGYGLVALDPVEFQRAYYDARTTDSYLPEAYTVIDGAILVGPVSSETATDYQLVYEREYTALSADNDVPALPAGAHLTLIFGAASTGLKLQNDYTWQFFEQQFQDRLNTMRRAYLRDLRDVNTAYAADPLGDY